MPRNTQTLRTRHLTPNSTMEVTQQLLQKLVCSECDGVLRRGPVFQRNDGAAVCGPCQEREGAAPASRCSLYEATAPFFLFPCRYKENGCPDTVPFRPADAEGPEHEAGCEYRLYVCPVLGPEHCEWSGLREAMLQHCRDQHPDRVLDNPASITPDIRCSLATNFLIPSLHFLFLLHTRVCVPSGSLYYAVRLLAEPLRAADYIYSITIRRGEDTLNRTREVLPQEHLILKQHSALHLNINSLLGMLGGWDGATVSVEVRQRDGAASGPREAEAEQETCGGCGVRTVRLYQDDDKGWLCERCAPDMWTCINEGCDYQDFLRKRDKHSWWWCERRTECWVCEGALQGVTPAQHYPTCKRVTRGVPCLVPRGPVKWFLVESGAGLVLCESWYIEDWFWLLVFPPVSGRQLPRYRCGVRLECAGHTRTFTPHPEYNFEWDWGVNCGDREFLSGPDVRFWLDITRTG